MWMKAAATMDRIWCLWWYDVGRLARTLFALSADNSMPRQTAITADTQDVASALRGDDEAFARLVDRHQAAIAIQMQRFSRDVGSVEELVHEVFVEAFLSLKSYRSHAPFLHWLRKIAVRTGYRFWTRRKKERSRAVPIRDVAAELEQLATSIEPSSSPASQILGNLLECLAPRDRLVLTLLYWDGCNVAEAAELAGWSETMVKVQAFRARKRLKKLLEESAK